MKVSKLDAARRQLDTAIFLYFTRDDPISVHTLTAASRAVMDALLKARGMLDTTGIEMIRPEYRDSWLATIKEPANFFKHGSRDATDELDFRQENNMLDLLQACEGYRRLTGKQTVEMRALTIWLYLWGPEVFNSKPPEADLEKARRIFPQSNRRHFFDSILPAFGT